MGIRRTVVLVCVLVLAGALPARASHDVTLTPSSRDFGFVQVGTRLQDSFSARNASTGSIVLGTVTLSGANPGDFGIGFEGCSGTTLSPGGICFIPVTFQPLTTGLRTAVLTVPHSGHGGAVTSSLSGTGTSPDAQVSPTTLSFGSVQVGSSSPSQFTSIQNVGLGNGPVLISDIAIVGANAGDFAIGLQSCGTQIQPGGSCFVPVSFLPTAVGARAATLRISTNDPDSPHNVALNGSGVAPSAVWSPDRLDFGSVVVGQNSIDRFTEIRNTGVGPLSVGTVTVAGTNASDFQITMNNCTGTSVPVSGQCFVQLRARPGALGPRSATMSAATAAGQISMTLAVVGTDAIEVSPGAISFGEVDLGQRRSSFVTIRNVGTASVSVSTPTFTGPQASDFSLSGPSCGTISGGSSCFLDIRFTPTARGPRVATLSVTAAGSTYTVALDGIGAGPILVVPAALDAGDAELGVSGSIPLSIQNQGTSSLSITGMSLGSSHFSLAGGCLGASIPAGGTCQQNINVHPQTLGPVTATLSIVSNGGNASVSLSARGVDTTAPGTGFSTTNGSVRVSMLQQVSGTSADLGGVDAVSVRFTDVLGAATTVQATLTCGTGRRSCTFDAQVPLLPPGPCRVEAWGTDRSGNVEAPPARIELIVV